MIHELVVGFGAPVAEADQPRVVAELRRDLRFGAGLCGVSADAGDHREWSRPRLSRRLRLLHRKLEHRPVETDAGIANRELRRVDADRDAAGAGVDVVPSEPTLSR